MHTPPRTAAERGNQARVRIRAATAFRSGTNERIAQDGSRCSRLTKNKERAPRSPPESADNVGIPAAIRYAPRGTAGH